MYWALYRHAHRRLGTEVEDELGPCGGESVLRIADVALLEDGRSGHIFAASAREVIEHMHFHAARKKCVDDVRTDETRSACNQGPHHIGRARRRAQSRRGRVRSATTGLPAVHAVPAAREYMWRRTRDQVGEGAAGAAPPSNSVYSPLLEPPETPRPRPTLGVVGRARLISRVRQRERASPRLLG